MARAKMLLVEDDAALAELLIWHFKREDFEIAQTPDGEEALLLAKESSLVLANGGAGAAGAGGAGGSAARVISSVMATLSEHRSKAADAEAEDLLARAEAGEAQWAEMAASSPLSSRAVAATSRALASAGGAESASRASASRSALHTRCWS